MSTKVSVTKSKLDNLAMAVSAKSGESIPLTIDEMTTAVRNIHTGGTVSLQEKSVTPTETAQTVEPDDGYDGLREVNVGAVSSSYVGSSVPRRTDEDMSVSRETITAPAGYYATPQSKSVTTMTLPQTTQSQPAGSTVGTITQSTDGYSTQYLNISIGYNGSAGKYEVPPLALQTLPSNVASTSTGTLKAAISASDLSDQYLNIPTGYNGAAAYYKLNKIPSGSATPASSISGTGAAISTGYNTLTLTKTVSNAPQVSAGYVSSGTTGNTDVSLTATVQSTGANTWYPSTIDQTILSNTYLTGTQTIKAVTTTNLTADNIKSGVTVQIGDSADSDRVASVTGTYSGGGTSKNVQVVQGTTRTNASTLTAVGSALTVSKTGTYDVYWSGMRSNTSSSYTWATQLYVGGSAYGSENTTWTNNVQNNHLSNVSLTANQQIRVYGRNTRGTSYYIYAPTLVIVEA